MGRKPKKYSCKTTTNINNNNNNVINDNFNSQNNNNDINNNNLLNYFKNNESNKNNNVLINTSNNVKKRKRRTKKEIIEAKKQQNLLLNINNDSKICINNRQNLTNNNESNIVNYWMEDYNNNFKKSLLNNNNKNILLQNCSIVKKTIENDNTDNDANKKTNKIITIDNCNNNIKLQTISSSLSSLSSTPLNIIKTSPTFTENIIIDKHNSVKIIDNLFDKIILPVNNEIEYFKIMENYNTNIIDRSIKFEKDNFLQTQANDVKNFSKYKLYNQNSLELCNHCKIPLLISIEYDSLYCKNCKHKYNISDNTMATVSFLDEVELQIFPYQKPGHALKWKNNILWRSKKVIHVNILHYIMQNLKSKLNLHCVKDIKCHHINYIVRKLKLDSLYQHTTQIFCRITGTPPPTIEKDIEENGDLMFLAIQEPFKKYKKPERKNLFSYPFIWYKIWEYLGQYHLLDYLFLLSEKKLKEQSEFWEEICNDPSLNWKYIPTEIKNKYDYTSLLIFNNNDNIKTNKK